MDMRSEELQHERKINAELMHRAERLHYFESELGKARHRVEEMNLVVQNKMVAEKELIDMTEALANDLGKSRQEVLSLRRQLENKQYLLYNDHSGAAGSVTMIQQQQPCSMTSDYCSSTERGSPIEPHKRSNHQQKARCDDLEYVFYWYLQEISLVSQKDRLVYPRHRLKDIL